MNQDPLGKAALRLLNSNVSQVWAGPLSGGRTVAVLLNLQSAAAPVSVTLEQLGLKSGATVEATDLWSGALSTHTGSISGKVEAHGVLAFTLALK